MRTVAALCVAPNSVYKALSGVDAYDKARDARTYTGGMPIVAHPPCRSWSAYCAHQAKPEPGERELALWCVEQLRREGGVLEQPAHSRLWSAAGLPLPGGTRNPDCFALEVWQAWWGYPMRKATWLCFFGLTYEDMPPVPFRLHDFGADRRRQQLMSKHQRSATTEPFARWLLDCARLSHNATTPPRRSARRGDSCRC